MLRHDRVTLTGASDTDYSCPANGLVEFIKVAYTNGDAGGDLAITDEFAGTAILTLTDNNTAFESAVRKVAVDNTGGAIATAVGSRIPVSSRFKLVSAQQAANTTVVVDLWWSE